MCNKIQTLRYQECFEENIVDCTSDQTKCMNRQEIILNVYYTFKQIYIPNYIKSM